MKTISITVLSLIICSCTSPEPDVISALNFENYGYNGNRVIVLREGRIVTVLEPISHQGLVDGVKQIDLNIGKNPFLQAFHSSHQGNGVFAIYESYHNGGLICLLAIHGHDSHKDEMTFKNGHVDADYLDINDDGYTDIVITGEVLHWDEGDNITRTTPIKRIFVWNQNANRNHSFTHNGSYEEVVDERVGIINNDEFYEYKQLTKYMNEQVREL